MSGLEGYTVCRQVSMTKVTNLCDEDVCGTQLAVGCSLCGVTKHSFLAETHVTRGDT